MLINRPTPIVLRRYNFKKLESIILDFRASTTYKDWLLSALWFPKLEHGRCN